MDELLHFGASHATDGESNGPKGKRCCDHIISFACVGFCAGHTRDVPSFVWNINYDISSEFSLVGWEKNLILGSFSCGYAIGQIPCGLFVMKFGGTMDPCLPTLFQVSFLYFCQPLSKLLPPMVIPPALRGLCRRTLFY